MSFRILKNSLITVHDIFIYSTFTKVRDKLVQKSAISKGMMLVPY